MVIRFLTVMMKHGYIGEFEVGRAEPNAASTVYNKNFFRWLMIIVLARLWSISLAGLRSVVSSRPAGQVRFDSKIITENQFKCRFDIALNDIEKWTNNLLWQGGVDHLWVHHGPRGSQAEAPWLLLLKP